MKHDTKHQINNSTTRPIRRIRNSKTYIFQIRYKFIKYDLHWENFYATTESSLDPIHTHIFLLFFFSDAIWSMVHFCSEALHSCGPVIMHEVWRFLANPSCSAWTWRSPSVSYTEYLNDMFQSMRRQYLWITRRADAHLAPTHKNSHIFGYALGYVRNFVWLLPQVRLGSQCRWLGCFDYDLFKFQTKIHWRLRSENCICLWSSLMRNHGLLKININLFFLTYFS